MGYTCLVANPALVCCRAGDSSITLTPLQLTNPLLVNGSVVTSARDISCPTTAYSIYSPYRPPASSPSKHRLSLGVIIGSGAGGALALLLVIGLGVLCRERRKLHTNMSLQQRLLTDLEDDVQQLKRGWEISAAELELQERIDGDSPGVRVRSERGTARAHTCSVAQAYSLGLGVLCCMSSIS